ncbi:MAG: substrate-binding domain-containing protein [Pseudomonadota bacterium]
MAAHTAQKRVTIRHLADSLGLTKGTVSRALNGYPDIAEATQLRVRRQAEVLGYRPLSQAQGIRTGRTRSIGLVFRTDLPNAQRPFIADFLAGVSRRASADNWTLTVATAASESELLDLHRRLIDERKADGFILPRTDAHDARVAVLRETETPFVLYGRMEDLTDCAWFDISGEEAMASAVERLYAQGHRRIAFVNGEARYNFSRIRREAILGALAQRDLPTDASLLDMTAMTHDAGRKATDHLLASPTPPTAIIFATDLAAVGAYTALKSLNLKIGQDVSVISYDGMPEGEYADPGLTTFEVDNHYAGHRLAELLIRRVRGESPETLRELAPAKLAARGSDGPPAMTSDQLATRLRAAA